VLLTLCIPYYSDGDEPRKTLFDARVMGQIIAAAGAEVWIWNRNRGGRVTHKMGGHDCRLYCLR